MLSPYNLFSIANLCISIFIIGMFFIVSSHFVRKHFYNDLSFLWILPALAGTFLILMGLYFILPAIKEMLSFCRSEGCLVQIGSVIPYIISTGSLAVFCTFELISLLLERSNPFTPFWGKFISAIPGVFILIANIVFKFYKLYSY